MNCITELPEVQLTEASQIRTLYEVLCQVPDQRKQRGRRYPASLVLALLLLGKMAGERSMSGISHWVRLHQAELQPWLPLVRVPCTNTYHYICQHIDVTALTHLLHAHFPAPVSECEPALEPEPPTRLRHVAVDGKGICGTYRSGVNGQSAVGLLGLYEVQNGLMQTLLPIAGKGKERAVAQASLPQKCQGYLFTADALYTQHSFCRQIRKREGHYLLIVKRNQRTLHDDIAYLFSLPPDPAFPEQAAQTFDYGHGRLTHRRIRTSCELNAYLGDQWPDVAQVFQVQRQVTRQGKTTSETVYGITSLAPELASPADLLAYLQAHWHIENRNHWRRDATLGEDASTIRNPTVAMVCAALNCLILALFDRTGVANARMAIRTFNARPADALALLFEPL
jgi:predicted transposase YbfD/YdcC